MRFPQLFVAFLVLLGIDLVVPDFVPFADEIGLALITLLLGAWKARRGGRTGPSELPSS